MKGSKSFIWYRFLFYIILSIIIIYNFSFISSAEIVSPEDVSCLNDALYRCPDCEMNLSRSPKELKMVFIQGLLGSGNKFALHLPMIYKFMDSNGIPREFLEIFLSGYLDHAGNVNPYGWKYNNIIWTDYEVYKEWARIMQAPNPSKLFAGKYPSPQFFYKMNGNWYMSSSFKTGLIQAYEEYLVYLENNKNVFYEG